MDTLEISLNNPVVRNLACAALSPGLRSILAFDVSLETFTWIADILAKMLEVTTGRNVTQYTLSAVTTEADLWGRPTLSQEDPASAFTWHPGILTESHSEAKRPFKLVTLPNLLHLNTTIMRACVMAVGNDVVYLERYGRHEQLEPQICWLARCDSSDVGQLSPHLLDRFTLRLSGFTHPVQEQDRASAIQEWIDIPEQTDTTEAHLPPEIIAQLEQAQQTHPPLDDSVADTVCWYFEAIIPPGCRREIALARLAIARARLSAAKMVSDQHVHQAAATLGLRRPADDKDRPEVKEPEKPKPRKEEPKSEEPEESSSSSSFPDTSTTTIEKTPVYTSDVPTTFPTTPLVTSDPYPEDTAPLEREAYTLQLPAYQGTQPLNDRGPIIGVKPADTLQDLAIVATLFETHKYQTIRQKHTGVTDHCLLLTRSDLRGYRRAPIPETLLALLVDYTALKKSNWQEVVLPYIQWAYVERANLCIVKVGSADARYELRAERITAHSVLTPCVAQALDTLPGQATPLAHGLDLVFQTLRHALQHGRGTVREATLVVLTDGRGNVPLQNSRTGRISHQINREGITDAIEIAQHIHSLENLQVTLYTPQLNIYPELPFTIAKTLGSDVFEIPHIQEDVK